MHEDFSIAGAPADHPPDSWLWGGELKELETFQGTRNWCRLWWWERGSELELANEASISHASVFFDNRPRIFTSRAKKHKKDAALEKCTFWCCLLLSERLRFYELHNPFGPKNRQRLEQNSGLHTPFHFFWCSCYLFPFSPAYWHWMPHNPGLLMLGPQVSSQFGSKIRAREGLINQWRKVKLESGRITNRDGYNGPTNASICMFHNVDICGCDFWHGSGCHAALWTHSIYGPVVRCKGLDLWMTFYHSVLPGKYCNSFKTHSWDPLAVTRE